MPGKTIDLTESIYNYMLSVSLRETEVQKRLREDTRQVRLSEMQITPDQGQFMAFLAHLIGAARAIEVGVYTGYSALCVAQVLPEHGQLIACDISEKWTGMAKQYWREAGVDARIDLRLGEAEKTLDDLLVEGQAGTFDFAFIDADKNHYARYYEQILQLLRPKGLLLIDNVLWSGKVLNPDPADAEARSIHALNCKIHSDGRVMLSMLPISDGVTLVQKL